MENLATAFRLWFFSVLLNAIFYSIFMGIEHSGWLFVGMLVCYGYFGLVATMPLLVILNPMLSVARRFSTELVKVLAVLVIMATCLSFSTYLINNNLLAEYELTFGPLSITSIVSVVFSIMISKRQLLVLFNNKK